MKLLPEFMGMTSLCLQEPWDFIIAYFCDFPREKQ